MNSLDEDTATARRRADERLTLWYTGGLVVSLQPHGTRLGMPRFAAFASCAAGPSSHLNEGEGSMGKGNNSQKNDKKNKKVKQDSKKQVTKSSNKK